MALSMGLLGGAAFVEPTGSFDLLETQVLGANASSVTFSSLNTYAADYQHLQIRAVSRAASDAGSITLQFNADTGANYFTHRLLGTGSSVISDAFTNYSFIWAGANATPVAPTGAFGASVIDILDPFETTKNTTTRTFAGRLLDYITLSSGGWANTGAVNQIRLAPNAGGSFIAGSRFSLYGIRSA